MFSKRPKEHLAGALPFPFMLVILANYWRMVVPDEKQPQSLKTTVILFYATP